MSSSHDQHEPVDLSSQNKFMNRLIGLGKLFDGPATFFRGFLKLFFQ